MWVLAVALAATMAAFLTFAVWQSRFLLNSVRRCTECGGDRQRVPPAHRHRTYEVLACPQCTDVTTAVHGQISRFAVCPSCSQFGLEVQATAVAPSEVGEIPPVVVEERCRICGFADEWAHPELVEDLPNNVIEFPRR